MAGCTCIMLIWACNSDCILLTLLKHETEVYRGIHMRQFEQVPANYDLSKYKQRNKINNLKLSVQHKTQDMA